MKKVYFLILFCLLFIPSGILAEEVHIYLFYGSTCSICESERSYLKKLNNVKVHEFEVYDNNDNYNNMKNIKELYGISKEGVPFTVVGDTAILGFNASRQNKVEKLVNKYSDNDYYDRVGVFLGLYEDEEIIEEETLSKEDEEPEQTKENNNSNWVYLSISGIILIIVGCIYVYIKRLKKW